jgi:DNA polymerase
MSEWSDTIDDLIGYLRYCQERGQREIEFNDIELISMLDVSGVTRKPLASASVPSTETQPSSTAQKLTVQPATSFEPTPFIGTSSALTAEEREAKLKFIAEKIAECKRCDLHKSRNKTVPGQGNFVSPEVMFIGEAPGAEEDQQGLAFVGAAGQLLTKMIVAMGFTREEVFIGNICKCRPPGNRQPTLEEMNACLPFLREQVQIIRPKIIVALGATAAKGLLGSNVRITQLRGHWTKYNGIPLMPTFHPAYLLRFPDAKRSAWSDLKAVLNLLGRPIPKH